LLVCPSCLCDPHRGSPSPRSLCMSNIAHKRSMMGVKDPPFYSIVENTEIVINSGTKLKLALATCLHSLEISN
ncbi:hypothetical protein KC19_5G082700, partial [Ceratodon purpureus]